MSRDGMNYRPEISGDQKTVEEGVFPFAAAYFDHGHIYGQIEGLAAAGGNLKYVYDPSPSRYEEVLKDHPDAKVVNDFREILDDPEVKLVTAAAIPNLRCGIGIQVMESRKDYLTDKSPFTTMEQLAEAKAKVEETGMKYIVCYSERLLNEAAWHAGELLKQGAIGRVLQVLSLAPHQLSASSRPEWFFEKERYGGILTDIGSHQFEQFLEYSGAGGGKVLSARVENLSHPEYPELEDFGEASLKLDNGVSAYCRADWFNPSGSKVWGDGRTFVMGTDGYLEIRKQRDIVHGGSDKIYMVDSKDEHLIDCKGKVGFPFFGKLILDCLERGESAMTQAHAFKAAELSMEAQLVGEAN